VVKTHGAQDICLLNLMVFMALPPWAESAQSEPAGATNAQRATCDAKCREDYQSNAAALQACLRGSGAIGPASPSGAIAPGLEATHTVQQAGTATAHPAAAINLNSSRSNVYRSTGGSGASGEAAEATTVKGSKSNSDNRATTVKSSKSNSQDRLMTEPAVSPPAPAESANLNLSKSNINRSAEEPSGAGDQPAAEGTIHTTKSNTFKSQAAPGTDDMPPEQETGEAPPEEQSDDSPTDR
jgi:hypothetical protein